MLTLYVRWKESRIRSREGHFQDFPRVSRHVQILHLLYVLPYRYTRMTDRTINRSSLASPKGARGEARQKESESDSPRDWRWSERRLNDSGRSCRCGNLWSRRIASGEIGRRRHQSISIPEEITVGSWDMELSATFQVNSVLVRRVCSLVRADGD